MSNLKEVEIVKNADITPKRDIVFKRIFGAKGNEGILKDFLESILEIRIDSLELDLATELLPEFYDGKKSRVDVRARLSDGTEINIEVQTKTSDYSDKRCLQHWSKLYSNTLREGGKYTDLKKTICIWILDGKIYKEFSDYHSKWEIMNEKHMVTNRFNELEFHMIELKKLRKNVKIKPSKKNFWLWFIDHTNRELVHMACVNNKKIEEARKQLDKIRADKELMERIRLEEAYEMDVRTAVAEAESKGRSEGEAVGFENGQMVGAAKEKKEMALKLLKLNLPIEQISEVTGLSRDEIEKMK